MTPRTLLALLALASVGCTRTEQPPAASGPAPAGGTAPASVEKGADTLVIATQADAESFISVVYQSAHDAALGDNMALGLTTPTFDCRLEVLPGIAESWEHPEDGLSITYHLRKDLKWSDGHPITADDIKFTFDLVADPAVASPRIAYVEHMKPDARPRVLDPYTVRFEFTHAYDRTTQISHTSSLNPLPKHVLEKFDRGSLRATDFDKAPVVSGPWMLGKWDKGSTITFVPNPQYGGAVGPPPSLARVIFKVIPEYATRLIELENGSVDMIENFQTMDDIARIRTSRPDIKLYRRGWRFMDYIAWNLRDPLFEDKSVRQALTMAIDRQKLIRDLLTIPETPGHPAEVVGVEAVSWITPELCDYKSDAIQPFPFNPAKSREMLAAAGWTDTNGDGILDKDGKPFSFTLITNTGNARRAKASIIIQANLKDAGIDCKLGSVESNLFFERTRKKDFQAALSGWSAGLFVDPTDLWHSDTPEKKQEFNFTSYSNPVADELIDRGMKTPALADQAPIWQELQEIIYDDQPYTFLFWRDEVVGLHERFEGAKIDMLSEFHDLHEWWVPADKVKYKL